MAVPLNILALQIAAKPLQIAAWLLLKFDSLCEPTNALSPTPYDVLFSHNI